TGHALDMEENDSFRKLVLRALENTDERVAQGLPVTPMFLLGVFLWRPAMTLADTLIESGDSPLKALIEASDTVLRAQQRHVSVPRRFGTPMREMMTMQLRFQNQHGRRALRLLEHPRFRAAFDFLRLRVEAGDEDPEVFKFWERLESMDNEHRQAAVKPKRGERGRRRRPRRRKQKPS
ncbi:MAG: polynucleotide adenylyltransferase PcnB, partial [Gammaproteobacteria bacterium]